VTNNFVVTNASRLKTLTVPPKCRLVPITLENYCRVREFRHKTLVLEYQDKLSHGEVGCFAEVDGLLVGSIWATVNGSHIPALVRGYMRLLPREALIHDIVTGEKFRGVGIGPYMVSGIVEKLLSDQKVDRIIIDVNVKNGPSLRMMDKVGLHRGQQMLYVSAFGRQICQKTLRRAR
jgi:RimJ/RimL family protein N-acetyltransferase